MQGCNTGRLKGATKSGSKSCSPCPGAPQPYENPTTICGPGTKGHVACRSA